MAAARHLQPTVEDCEESDEGVVKSSAPSPPSLPKANVHQKRSNPSVADKAPPLRPMDQQSDSGYSSLTAATMSSADSAPSATTQRNPPPRPPPGPSHSPSSRTARPERPERPERPAHHRHSSSQSSSQRPPLERTSSHASRRPSVTTRPSHARRDSRVSDIRAEECPQPSRRPRPSHPEVVPDALASRDREIDQYERERSRRRDSAYHATAAPPSQYYRQHHYHNENVVIQPATTRRRPSNAGPRPVSYHGDPAHIRPHMQLPHSPQLEQHGPPLSRSSVFANPTYGNPQMHNHYMQHPQHPPQQQHHYYPQPQPQQMQPHTSYDPRVHNPYAPQPGYGRSPMPPPIITQPTSQLPSARGPPGATHARPPTFSSPAAPTEYYEDSSDSDASSVDHEPPPPPPPPPAQRPTRRLSGRTAPGQAPQPPPPPPPSRPKPTHAKTTPAGPPTRRQPPAVVVAEPRAERDRRGSLRAGSRPPHIKSNSYDTHNARVIVESPCTSRRETSQVYVEDRRRPVLKQYHPEPKRPIRRQVEEPLTSESDSDSEYGYEEEVHVPRVLNRSHQSSRRPERERVPDARKEVAAESYINANRGFNETCADRSYRAAKRGSRVPSEAESSHSRGSDRQSHSGGNGEIRLKVDANAPVNLILNGDLEGRRLQLMPADEGGMAELVISGGHGTERSYISERSRHGQRAIMPSRQPRREAEEFSERSSRSGHIRRDTHTRDDQERRHVLRRRA
jgi:hypothetical protein